MVEISFTIFASNAITYRPLINRIFGSRRGAASSEELSPRADPKKNTIGGGKPGAGQMNVKRQHFGRAHDVISVGSEEWRDLSAPGDRSRMGSIATVEGREKDKPRAVSVVRVTSVEETSEHAESNLTRDIGQP